MEMAPDFRRLFDPRHKAVIGASPNHVHGRYDYIDWHIRAGFSGTLYPVNPRYTEVKGLKCYPALKDIPGEVDIVISMIPAEATVELLRDTPAGKVHYLVVIASGVPTGNVVNVPDLTGNAFATFDYSRSSGADLPTRPMFGFTMLVSDLGVADPSTITGVQFTGPADFFGRPCQQRLTHRLKQPISLENLLRFFSREPARFRRLVGPRYSSAKDDTEQDHEQFQPGSCYPHPTCPPC